MDDSSDEDSFVVIGTPLTPYQEGESLKKPLSVGEQEVKDNKGRARFHGAFTGGFSAGYFNTVGSKQGFTPSIFVSSRNKEKDVTVSQDQRPEDFMDDEDFGEHGIAPRLVSATSDFGRKDGKRKVQESLGEALLNDLIVPARTSIGFKLLRDLGWRDGQGVGARRKRKVKQDKAKGERVYGCALPQSGSEESDVEFVPDHVTFAPKDVNPVRFQPKDNVHGLGYRGIRPASSTQSGFSLFSERDPTSGPARTQGIAKAGQAFGVGDFEDEDDVDVYGMDDPNKYDRVLGGPNKHRNYGWTAPKHQGQSSAPVGYLGQVLEGFKLSKSTLKPKKTFPPPQLPKDFKPFHKREAPAPQTEGRGGPDRRRTKPIDANVRKGMLGELKSVFDLVPAADKAKMEAAKKQPSSSTDHLSEQKKVESRFQEESSATSKPSTDKASSSKTPLIQGNTGFKPFAADPEKQQRYEQYLEHTKKGGQGEANMDSTPRGSLTEWERGKEREEFARAARLYRPLAGMMASRFTSAKYQDNEEVEEGVAEQATDKSDLEKAAEMKMFGRLTRERLEWHPERVLCKRFNVANPYPGSTMVGVPRQRRDKYSVFTFLSQPPEVQETQEEMVEEGRDEGQSDGEKDDVSLQSAAPGDRVTSGTDQGTVTIGNTEDTSTGQDVEAEKASERPAMDIFRAIFSESSEEEEDSAEEVVDSEKTETEKPKASTAGSVLSAIFGQDSASDKTSVNTSKEAGDARSSHHGNHQDSGAIGSSSIPVQSLSERLAPPGPKSPDSTETPGQSKDPRDNRMQGKDTSQTQRAYNGRTGDNICGPALPPGFSVDDAPPHQVRPPRGREEVAVGLWVTSQDSNQTRGLEERERERRKKHRKHSSSDRRKKSKHKKHKHKSSGKKKKKQKKQKRKKDVIVISSTSSSSSDESGGSDTEQRLRERLKSIPKDRRPTAMDFM